MGELASTGKTVTIRVVDEFVHVATYLPVRHWWHVIAFLRMASRVQKQAKTSPGIVRYAVRAAFRRKRFWTYSIWRDRVSIGGFVRAKPHATAIARFPDWAGEGAAFSEWTSTATVLDWVEAMRRLENPTFYYKQPAG